MQDVLSELRSGDFELRPLFIKSSVENTLYPILRYCLPSHVVKQLSNGDSIWQTVIVFDSVNPPLRSELNFSKLSRSPRPRFLARRKNLDVFFPFCFVCLFV